MAIDVGAAAIDRVYAVNNAVYDLCLIEGSNPAVKSGKLVTVRFWLEGTMGGGIKVGTFYKTNGDIFSSRDSVIFTPVDYVVGLNEKTVELDIQAGDYIGIRLYRAGAGTGLSLDYDGGWTNDYWRTLAQTDFPYTNYTFDNLGQRIISLNGELEKGGMVGLNPAFMELMACN